MIIDFISECTSIIKCSAYDTINAGVISNNYSVKKSTDMLSWKLTNPAVSSVQFVILSSEVKTLKELQLELTGFQNVSSAIIKIETSLDYINWYEPIYKNDDKYLYLRSSSPSGDYYFNLTDPNNGKDTDLNNNLLTYSFKKYDENTKETTYLYNNFEFKFIKISLSNLIITPSDVCRFKTFSILIEDAFNTQALNSNLLQVKSSMFTQQKIFETEEFIPDMFKNYFKMIDEGKTYSSTLLYANPIINVDGYATSTYGEGIGNDIIEVDTIVYEDIVY